MTTPGKPFTPEELEPRTGSGYPEKFRARVLPREKRSLGDAAGLTKIGVNYTVLHPGAQSALRHWHTQEDEFVFVLSGELMLKTNDGEQTIKAGMGAGFPAGVRNGHQLINRGSAPAVYLEISNRDPFDQAFYPDDDLHYGHPVHPGKFTHRDGTPY